MSDLISCIVPVRNGERYLADTVDSILAQTHTPLEIILVDNQSTDGTAAIARRYASRVRYVFNNGATDPATGRNVGLAAATGAFLAFLDADDLWLPHKTAVQLQQFAAQPGLDICVAQLENFWSPDVPAGARWFHDDRRPMIVTAWMPQAMLATRDAFTRFGPWDPAQGHAANSEWFARAQARGARTAVAPEVLVRRRLHATNTSRLGAHDSHDDHLRMVKRLLDQKRGRLHA
jgi:glycosyltransferase involved in cell wall biosynthesis